MTYVYSLGRLFGLRLSVEPLAIIGSIALLVLLSLVAVVVLAFPIGVAVVAAFVAVIIHWLSEIVHDLGHAWAARSTGYPMTGIQLGRLAIFSTCLYPPNEPSLPARTHIRRALGGPVASMLLSLVAAVVLLILPVSNHDILWWIALFFFLDNFLVFALGAFLPLGFTDGSTLLYWWGKR